MALLLGIGVAVCGLVAWPFLPALVWAVTLAVVAAPLHRWIHVRCGNRAISASLAVVAVLVAIVLPVLFVGDVLLTELRQGIAGLQEAFHPGDWRRYAPMWAQRSGLVDWLADNVVVDSTVQSLAGWFAAWSRSVIQSSLSGIVTFLFTLYILFYFLRDAAKARGSIAQFLPLTEAEFDRVARAVTDTIVASVYGTVAVASLQGLLGGLMFWWLGLSAPVFWGIVMGLLAIVPFLGAFVIWAPVAVGLVLAGHPGQAAVLAVWGLLVIGLIDNLLYPILVGRRIAMHPVVSLIAILGGLALFGTYGVVLGPLCVAVTLVLFAIARDRQAIAGSGAA